MQSHQRAWVAPPESTEPVHAMVAPEPVASVTETAPQRRARLLECWESEETASGKHGALARVFAREKERRPTADRSNIGTDIRTARTERAQARRGAAVFGALGK